MTSSTRTPPLVSDGVFAVHGSSVINASREQVWKVLFDFDSYEKWNPFVRKLRVVDASKRVFTDNAPAEGRFLDISPVHIPPTMSDPGLFGKNGAFCEITVIDHENYRAAWQTAANAFPPHWLLFAERWQTLTELEDGQTRYDTTEVFFGPVAYLVKFFVGSGLQLGFQAMADTLKARVEANEEAGSLTDSSQ